MMEAIYILAAIFAVLMVVFGLGCLMPQYNPIWIYKQKREIAAGDVRWGQFSPKYGDGHKIYVIKEFDVKKDGKKHRVIFDSYIKTGGEYVMDIADMNYSMKDFLQFSDPEPVAKDERICAKPSTKSSSKKSA